MAQAELFEALALFRICFMASGVIGIHQHNGLCTRGDPSLKLGKVDPPSVVVEERIGLEMYIFEVGEKVEEWVTWLSDEHLIASIAEQAKEIAITFTGAGRQEQGLRTDIGLMICVVGRYSFASKMHSAGVRIVEECARVAQGSKDGLNIVLKATCSGIGDGEINQVTSLSTGMADGFGKSAFGEIPAGSG